MLVRYCTRRDTNGNRYYLIIDHDNKVYSRQPAGFFHISDYTQIAKRDLRRNLDFLKTFLYKEVDAL